MQLKYKIEYSYDYQSNAILITLSSPFFQKEYPSNNVNNIGAVLGHAIVDFNEMHKSKIEELQDEETVKAIKEKKPNSKEFTSK